METRRRESFKLEDLKKEIPLETVDAEAIKISSTLPIVDVAVEPLLINEIVDEQGKVSSYLDNIAQAYDIFVIPGNLVNLPRIKSFQRYSEYQIAGEKYYAPNGVREDVIRDYENKIVNVIKGCREFSESMWLTYSHNNTTGKTLKLSVMEWSTLVARFRNYGAYVGLAVDGDIRLMVKGVSL